jgi:hypothetical protein
VASQCSEECTQPLDEKNGVVALSSSVGKEPVADVTGGGVPAEEKGRRQIALYCVPAGLFMRIMLENREHVTGRDNLLDKKILFR